MSLSLALNSAQTALSVTSQQTAITARNITGANDPAYSRKVANVATSAYGSTYVASIGRAQDQALYTRMLEARSDAAARSAHLDGLERLAQTIGDPQDDYSVAGALGAFQNALQMHADGPSDPILAGEVLGRAHDLAERLDLATQTVQAARATADGEMVTSVARINDLLARFETTNRAVVAGTAAGADVTDALDTRAKILTDLSQEIGVTTIVRGDNDMVIYTDSGVTLFEKTAREVSFTRTFAYDAGIDGQAVFADGVPITGPGATMGIKSGALYGHAMLRDETSGVYQKQLDEIARGLILATAETDQINDPAVLAPQAGLFTWGGGPNLPPGTTAIDNLSASLRVNPAADPGQGGDLSTIRDGGMNGAAYDYNPAGAASFSGRMQGLIASLEASQPFDATAGVNPNTSLGRFAAGSVGWLESTRKQADKEASYQITFLERTQESLSNETGVNLDEELALMLELERSYGASARIITAVDTMLASLLQAVR
ncbi:flagellar hook-associated protein FlgK [Salinarimonas ramus]|uniref:Flagellar hook-associated protein 1 n=1 Tax=Salinarimonas ramus TaxID=690164 RepID=A0A917Q805_9HYPH|nr:flagellar hook-associated protein FlgK [Salinarimonas ramus]GGK33141.1 flagellar hook protein FlgK [Salinarimonas ramus]